VNEKKAEQLILLALEDITDRVRSEKILIENEARSKKERTLLHDFFTQTPAVLAILKGPEYVFEFANPAYMELIGNRNLIGKKLLEAVPEVKGQGFIELLDNVYKTGETFTGKEMPIMVEKGKGKPEQFFLNFTYQAFTNDKGETEGVLVFAYDVTELVIGRKQVEASSLMIRNIYMNAPAAICTFKGPEHIYELVNPAYQKLFDKRDLVGKSLLEALPELNGQGVNKILDNVYNTGEVFISTEIPVMLARADNEASEQRYFNTTMQPIYNEETKIIGVVNFGYDVTEQIMARKQIEESEKRFSNILSQSIMSIAILKGADLIIAFANDKMMASWGKGKNIIGKPLLKVLYELEDQPFPNVMQQVFTTGIPHYGYEEKAILIINGKEEVTYYNYVCQPYTEVDNTISGVTILANEVTEQVLAKKQIEESEKRFSNILSQSLMAVCILKGRELVVTSANDSMLEMWGKGKNVIGNTLIEVLPEIEDQPFLKLLDDVYTTGVPFATPEIKAILNRNGKREECYFNLIYQPYRDLDETVTGITVFATEVTKQVFAQKQIEESESKFRTLSETIPNMIWAAAPDGQKNFFNKYFLDYTGLSFEELQGDGMHKIIFPADLKKDLELWHHSLKTGEDFNMEKRIRHHDGTYHWHLTHGRAQKDMLGNITGWIGSSTEIEKQKIFSEELEAKVKERTAELQISNEELNQSNTQLDQFAYIASHDLQEPLRKIITFSTRLQDKHKDELNTEVKSYLNKIEVASSRMSTLIRDLLNYSRLLQHEKLFMQTDLNETLKNILNDFELFVHEKNAQIKSDKLPTIDAIPFQMNQLFSNLISNALKFSEEDVPPVIAITSRTLSEKEIQKYPAFNPLVSYVEIIFKDSGIGFEQQYAEKIFTIFQRLHNQETFIGTGIGLALAKKVIENHHGEIFADAKENEGASFHIILPLKQRDK
ncbi:MAG: PAS domain-containing protein, partial [Chryseolinea sp.]